MASSGNVFQKVKSFLFSSVSKEVLIFLSFLLLAAIFWLLMTLNENYEKEYKVPISISNVPKNVMLTSGETDSIMITLEDKGFVLLSYLYGNGFKPLTFDFSSYVLHEGYGSIPAADMKKLMLDQVAASTKVISLKPDAMEFNFNYGQSKRVPVRWSGRVVPEHPYYIAQTKYSPDSVTIYANSEKLDSIQIVCTEQLNISDFRDTLSVDCNLVKMKGVKTVPATIHLTFFTDVLTEESIGDIPIEGINMPAGMMLRTFPSKAVVKFVTGMSRFKTLSADDFKVVVDYNDIVGSKSDKCKLLLLSIPDGISRANLEIDEVDYLIEDRQISDVDQLP